MEYDINKILIAGMSFFMGLLVAYSKPYWTTKERAIFLSASIGGILIIATAVIFNSYFEQRWEFIYVKDFLFLKKVSGRGLRKSLTMGYFMLFFGLPTLLMNKFREIR